MAKVSAQDDEKLKSLSEQYVAAKASGADTGVLDAIHAQAENIRNPYGFSGGADGSGYTPINTDGVTKNVIASATPQNDYINGIFAAKQQQTIAGLKSAYDQNTSTLDAAAAKIPETYTAAKNATAGSAAVNQSNFDERAVASGLNSGAGGQAALSMGNTLTNSLSALDKAQSNALTDIETQRSQLALQYQNAIALAKENNNVALATALKDEATRVDDSLVAQSQAQADENSRYESQQYEIRKNRADTAAAYGDLSGYKALGYSDEQIAAMQAYLTAKTSYTYTPTVKPPDAKTFNEPEIDENSPYGVITDIGNMRSQGFSSAQIKANAKAGFEAGDLTAAQYQMYVQYAGA